MTLATPANMREFEAAHPGRDVELPDGSRIHVEGARCFAFSPYTGEEYSGASGDYWRHGDTEPVTDDDGNPMVLAVRRGCLYDALTEERL